MRIVRIYQPGPYAPGMLISLSPAASQHVGTVLRMQLGATLSLFCGDGYDYAATIYSIERKTVTVHIDAKHYTQQESACAIHLAQAIAKKDSMDWVMQKAVELGVTSITPLITQYSVVHLNQAQQIRKHAHWQAIMLSACEQTGRSIIPMLHPVTYCADYIANANQQHIIMLHPESLNTLHTIIKQDACLEEIVCNDRQAAHANITNITIMIGPEGGWSKAEIEHAAQMGIKIVRFGPRILRTETASLAIISVLQALYGDLNCKS